MIIIPINKASIKKNPKAFETLTNVQGRMEAHFECNGELPDELNENVIIMDWEFNISGSIKKCAGIIVDPYNVEPFLKPRKGLNIKVECENHNTFIEHLPSPEYLYEYENLELECNHCHNLIHLIDIEIEDRGEDGEFEINICPICKEEDSFPEYKYEDIKNVKIKPL